MLADRIEAKWIDAFCEIFERCAVKAGDTAAILSETQSRALNVHLAELALLRMGARPFHVVMPTPRNRNIVPVRSTGASEAIQRLGPVISALQQAGFVVDCTIEGLMHAVETPEILKAGARILVISNEHPEALERMVPDTALEKRVRAAAKMLRGIKRMRVTSKAGSDLDVDMVGASTVGVWGWTDKPGTLAHWPGGIVVSFPKSGTVNGTLVMAAGDINLTFKRYLTSPVKMILKDDYVINLEGEGADAAMMRAYLAAWGDREAYAVSHVGFGMNPGARYEALSMYDQRDTNGTELRAVSGNFLFSTGANEFAGRYTAGHFDLPIMGTTIELDGVAVVREVVLRERLLDDSRKPRCRQSVPRIFLDLKPSKAAGWWRRLTVVRSHRMRGRCCWARRIGRSGWWIGWHRALSISGPRRRSSIRWRRSSGSGYSPSRSATRTSTTMRRCATIH